MFVFHRGNRPTYAVPAGAERLHCAGNRPEGSAEQADRPAGKRPCLPGDDTSADPGKREPDRSGVYPGGAGTVPEFFTAGNRKHAPG